MQPNERLISGQDIDLGGQKWTIPPLSLGQLRKLRPDIKVLEKIPTGAASIDDKQHESFVNIIHAAMSRNYSITRDQVESMVDLGNLMQVVQAVLGAAGMTPKAETVTE